MVQPLWKKRFFETTRGRAIQLLRAGSRTVDELASALGLSGTSVRAHLSQLESDGIVQHISRRGAGKPTRVYSLASEAEVFFHRAYGPLLAQVLRVLTKHLPPAELAGLMREAGRGLAVGRSVPVGDIAARTTAASAILTELGGMAQVERKDEETLMIRGLACPFATITTEHAEACIVVESFLEALIGAPVTQCCDRVDRPRCRFEVALSHERSPRASDRRDVANGPHH